MKFDKHLPVERLQPFVKYLAVSESTVGNEYKVLPGPGLVIGFQYRGQLAVIQGHKEVELHTAGITGISDTYKIFKNAPNIGTILVYFTETGFTHFASSPAHELFNLSLSLEDVFKRSDVVIVEERLSSAQTDKQRINIVERFLLSQLKEMDTDKLVVEAVKRIYQSKGAIRIKDLNAQLFISPSAFEKRFRKMVGATPKKFASIIRFNAILDTIDPTKSLTQICYEHNFFDQAHFIKDFKQHVGDTPEQYRRFL